MTLASTGPGKADYQIYLTDASGQVPNGKFDKNNLPQVEGTVTFEAARSETINLRAVGPYAYADSVTLRANVNGQAVPVAAITCPTPPAATAKPPVSLVTAALKITQEQGSGAACTPGATYFAYLTLTSTGAAKAQYQVYLTDGSGQVPDGVFSGRNSPQVEGTATFTAAGTQTVNLRVVGPYSYPNSITVRANVDGQPVKFASIACPAAPTATVKPTAVPGAVSASLRIVLEQGSGAACTGASTYFAYLTLTSTGAASAPYQVYLTDASGQVPDGTFFGRNSPQVEGTATFAAAGTQTVNLRVVGPYSYPNSVTVRANVNGKAVQAAAVACQ
jgi:hypothetical protein